MTCTKDDTRPGYDLLAFSAEDSSFKGDMACMDAPIFSLSKNKDTEDWEWTSVDRKRNIHIFPTEKYGRPTMFDKDIMLYLITYIASNLEKGRPVSRTLRFTPYKYFMALGKHPTGHNYKSLKNGLLRLTTTSIGTNIKTGSVEITNIFHLIESVNFYESGKQIEGIEVRISEWVFNSINSRQILSINPAYFLLEKPLEKRLYEIARKHVGAQPKWKIRMDKLKEKTGSRSDIYEFTRMLKDIQLADRIPDYRITINDKIVTFYQKDQNKLAKKLEYLVVDKT